MIRWPTSHTFAAGSRGEIIGCFMYSQWSQISCSSERQDPTERKPTLRTVKLVPLSLVSVCYHVCWVIGTKRGFLSALNFCRILPAIFWGVRVCARAREVEVMLGCSLLHSHAVCKRGLTRKLFSIIVVLRARAPHALG